MVEVGDIVKVQWLDIVGGNEDIDEDMVDRLEPCVAITYGKLLYLSQRKLTMACTEFPPHLQSPVERKKEFRDVVTMPRSVVKKISKIIVEEE